MFPEVLEYHVAPYISDFVKWLLHTFGPAFDSFSSSLITIMVQIEQGLLFIPWWLWAIGISFLSWLITKHVGKTILPAVLLMTVGVLGLWDVAMETLSIIIVSVLLALIIGIPSGIAMAVSKRVNAIFSPVLDAMQTMPSFVYLIPALMLFGLGKVPGVVATVIYAVPPVQRLTNLGIRQVSESVQEAAIAFGATPWQLMKEVRFPLAMPSILAGVNQTTMMALAMVVIASMIGAGGLGEKVLVATNRIDVGAGFEAGWAIVVLAIIIDRLSQGAASKYDNSSIQR